ncbi:carbamoyltransferase C-terminal domain-containing protein [Paenibacillus lutrae]|uniref:Carbamoyltransferase n=1 Tax=Paenibacillus lutrae TaxID=2078573 RepID=A0A7X3JYE0_9BACL|nr:carbamoyltransferase C-terminal domain-containing protein [Paenibacillus lutrae]MVO98854.1 carbamoyltransferase [Paenibacillus lutrae]
MQDGYYLSTYLHIGTLDYLYETCIRHDPNMALFRKTGSRIKLVRYWELERFTGMKQHRQSFFNRDHAVNVINELLRPLGLTMDDMEEIWGTPGLSTCEDYHSLADYPGLAYHSISHLFSAVMSDSRLFYGENIIGLAVDGIPDDVIDREVGKKNFFAGCVVRRGELELFPVESPGPLWDWASSRFKLREGTLMALASACGSEAPKQNLYLPPITDGSFNIWEQDYLRPLLESVHALMEKESEGNSAALDPRFTRQENEISMVMKQVQAESISIMEKNVEAILGRYGLAPGDTYLALAGGYALNCPTNSHLMDKYGFKGFIAPPCVNDSGLSLGMGLYAFYRKMSPQRLRFQLGHAYHGSSGKTLEEVLGAGTFEGCIGKVSPIRYKRAVEDLIRSPLIWFDGAAEIGPRALGHRSLLGDPRRQRTKDILNDIKSREWWRPVAPIILEGQTQRWFGQDQASPYMLHTYTVQDGMRELVPAALHLDGTARVQTVSGRGPAKRLHKLLRQFQETTGVPMLCNTSLNDKGEPIIQDVEEALHFALVKGIPVAYIDGMRVELLNHDRYKSRWGKRPYTRFISFELFNARERQEIARLHNPCGIPDDVLKFYKERIQRSGITRYDISNPADARRLTREVNYIRQSRGTRNRLKYNNPD